MDRQAVEAARTEFNRASDSVQALSDASDVEQIQTHWALFLSHADRMYNKLGAGAKASPKSKLWFDAKMKERGSDPLLCYIWKARNVDEHGLEFVTQQQPGFIREVTPTPQEREAFQRAQPNLPPLMTGHAVIEITRPHVRLMDVKDRQGNTYSPPLDYVRLYNTGMLALSRLEPILFEAEELIAPSQRADILKRIAEADRTIMDAAAVVDRQRGVVARLERDGHDAGDAKRLLIGLEQAHAMCLADRHRLQGELDKSE
jgi:hypothetical protein